MVWIVAVINGTGWMSLLFVTFPVIWILGSWLILSSLPEWGWSRRGLARAPGWQQLPFSSASHLLPEGAGCQLSSDPPSRGSRAVGLQVLLVVNSKKNLRNFFFLIDSFSSDFASYLSVLSPWQTPLTKTQGHPCLWQGNYGLEHSQKESGSLVFPVSHH